jgi:hypothetical protein
MDPFAMGLGVLFRGPRSVAAIYTPKGGSPRPEPIRVIHGMPDVAAPFSGQQVVEGTNTFQIQKVDAPDLQAGDRLTIGSTPFKMLGDPMGSVEGHTWMIGGSPIA